jgi:hypothetical protein
MKKGIDMKKKLVCLAFYAAASLAVWSADSAAPSTGPAIIRSSVFSTSTDWEALTGMRLAEYRVLFSRGKADGAVGTELYFLDGFPCYGQTSNVRAWVAPSSGHSADRDASMRITCIAPPKMLRFAWREAKRDAPQAATRGMLSCDAKADGGAISVNISECAKLADWKDYENSDVR